MPDEVDPQGDCVLDAPDPAAAVVVVRRAAPPPRRWSELAVTVRARLPELARHPVVVSAAAVTAMIATEVVVGVVRRAVGAGMPLRPQASPEIRGVVHVVHHHVVHHVVRAPVTRG